MNYFNDTFFLNFTEEVKKFHTLFKHNTLKGELLEELICNALNASNVNHEWACYGHQSNYDILIGDLEVSVKTGKVNKKNKLTVSSFRTTKYKTIEEKTKFMDENKSDIMFSCTHKNGLYTIYIIDTEIFKATGRVFEENNKSFKSINGIVDISINHCMSDQVWYTADLIELKIDPAWQIQV